MIENQQLAGWWTFGQRCKEERLVVCYGVEEVKAEKMNWEALQVTSSSQMLDGLWVLKSCLRIFESAAGPALWWTKH